MAKKKQILYPVVFMIALTAFFTFLLAFINNVTAGTIEEQQKLVVQRSVLYVFNIDTKDDADKTVQDIFTESISIETKDDKTLFTYKENGIIKGYAFEFSGKGLWGTITGHVAFDPSHQTMLGINFTAHQETPGLGGRIDEETFKVQFRDLNILSEQIVTLNKSTGGNVDAISGATLTSLAIRDIMNTEIPLILEFAKKEGFYEGN